jgi:glutamate dehydrogenase/leucine dehydrogenase
MVSKLGDRIVRASAWITLFFFLTTNAVRAFPVDIPDGLGLVDREIKGNGPLIVHIQDAHANFEAQKNIRNLLAHLSGRCGFSVVFLEGGASRLDPSLFRVFRDPARNEKFAERMVREGELSGAEWFLLGGADVEAYGVEDAGLYARDLALFKQVHLRRRAADEFLRGLESALENAARKYLNEALLGFFEGRNDFLAKHDFIPYAGILVRAAKEALGLDLAEARNQDLYPSLSRLAVLRLLGTGRPGGAEEDLRRLIAFLKSFPEGAGTARSLEDAEGLPRERPRHFLERLYDLAAPRGFSFRQYPDLSRAWEIKILETEIGARGLFAEEEALSGKIFQTLTRTKEEAEIIRLRKDLGSLAKLLRLELTREDYAALAAEASAVKPSVLAARLARVFRGVDPKPVRPAASADELFLRALDFYRLAERREIAFAENTARWMKRKRLDRAVIVTGGFHGQGLARRFAVKNFNYLAVRPEIPVLDPKETDRYLRGMLARRATRFDAAQINKALVLLKEDELIPGLTGLTRDPDYPDYLARQVVDAVTDAAPGRDALLEFSASPLARLLGVRVDPVSGAIEFRRAAALGQDRAGIENPFWSNTKKRLARLLERGDIQNDFYQSLLRMEAVYEKDLTVRTDGISVTFHANRIHHSRARGPAKGGIRILYAYDLAGDRVFMEALERLKQSGATIEEANAFQARWVKEMTEALAVEMSFKTALMNLPLGGAKSVIALSKIVEKDGQFVPESIFPSQTGRPSEQEMALVARALARYYAENGIVGPGIDSPAPDRNTDPRFMAWMTDEHLKVLLEKRRRREPSTIDRDLSLVNKLNAALRYDALRTMIPTETPFLEHAVLYSHRKDVKVPELAIYTGKSEDQEGQVIRDQSTAMGTLMLAEMIAEKDIWPGQVDPGRRDISHPVQTKRVAIQGFGNVGRNAALLFAARGAPVVAVNDVSKGIYRSAGFGRTDLARLATFVMPQRDRVPKFVKDYGEISLAVEQEFEPATFLTDIPPVDILIPAAVEGAISARNVDGIRATVILPAANGAVTLDAEEKLWNRTVRTYVFPDILASGGGVTISYREMIENTVKNARRWGQKKSVRWLRSKFQEAFDGLWEMVEREPGMNFGLAADRIAAERLQEAYLRASALGEEAAAFRPVWFASEEFSAEERDAVSRAVGGFSDMARGYRETGIPDTLWIVYDPSEEDTKTARIANFWYDPAHIEELEEKYGMKIPEDGVLMILGPNFRSLPREQWAAALKHELYHPWVDAALGNTFPEHYRIFYQALQRSAFEAENPLWQAFADALMEYQATRFKAERGDAEAALFDFDHVFRRVALRVFERHLDRLSYEEMLGEFVLVLLTGYQAFRFKETGRATEHLREIESALEPVFGKPLLEALILKVLPTFFSHPAFLKIELPALEEFEHLLDQFEALRNDGALEGLFIQRKREIVPPAPPAGSLGSAALPAPSRKPAVPFTPIHPALGVRLSEAIFVLKDEVHAAVGRVYPEFGARHELPDEITPEFYRGFIAALNEAGTPGALKIAGAFADEDEGLRELREVLQFRGPARAFMIESKLLGGPAAKRTAAFVTNAFAASLNRLENTEQQKAMIVLLNRVYKEALEIGNDMPLLFNRMQGMAIEVVASFFLRAEITGPQLTEAHNLFLNSLRSMRDFWEAEIAQVTANFKKHYLDPVPYGPWGFRLAPDAAALNASVLAVLREMFPGFEKGAARDTGIDPGQYFDFLMAVMDRDPALYARFDRTPEGRSVLNRLIGHAPQVARRYFDADEIFAPGPRSVKFLEAAWTRALEDENLLPAAKPALESALRSAAGQRLDPDEFGERLRAGLAALQAPEEVRRRVEQLRTSVKNDYAALQQAYSRRRLASSLGEVESYFEGRGYGTPDPETALRVSRGAAGDFLDPGTMTENPGVFSYLADRLAERDTRQTDPAVAAFNADLEPALRHLGVKLKDSGVPLILEEKIFGGAGDSGRKGELARKLAEVAGEGAILLLWDYGENRGLKPRLRRDLDSYAARGLVVRDFRLETLNDREVRDALADFKTPSVLLSTRVEPLSLDVDGEKIRMDLGFLARHGIDPVQALALFKQLADNPPEKRRELFFRAGLDLSAEGSHWLLGDRFVNSFLAEAYAEAAAQRALDQAA